MEKKIFFTELFYSDRQATIDVLNDLKEADLIINEDIYANGSILFAEAIDLPETRQILSKVISDIDQYWKENNDCFIDSVTDIPLNLLDDEFTHHFKDEIYLDDDTEIFFYR